MKTKILLIAALVSTLYSCKRDVDKDPKIETIIAKSIAAFMCYTKASVLEIGSYEITDHGFVYSNNNGTFGIENGTKISLGLGSFKSDTFSTVFPFGNSYNNSQSYYVRAYLSNKKGTVYGSILSFEPMLMTLGSIIPASGKAGERITITGNNFSAKPEENTVKFNTSIAKVVEASSTKLVVEVPNGINIGYNYSSSVIIYISVGGQTVNSTYFTLLPTIIGFSPTSGTFGTSITISGENLYGSSVKFDNIAGYVSSTTSNSLTTTIPNNITSDKIKIKVINNGVETILPGEFTLNPISISSVFPVKGFVGTQLKIIGAGFNPGYLSNVVKIGGVAVSTWNSDKNTINISVPESLVSGTYTVEVNNGVTNAVLANSFTVVTPKITGFSPSSGYFGSEVIIQGENLYSISYVNFGSIGAEIVSKDTSMIKVKVPSGITPGVTHISVNFGNKNYPSTDEFTILSPVITSFSPSSGTPGTEIIIKGNGFTAGYYNNTGVRFGTISTTVVSITSTEIKALVPSNAGEGAMKIAVVMPGITVVSTTDFTITK